MSAGNEGVQDTKAWRGSEKLRLEALSLRLSKPRKSALLDSLERVEGGFHKETDAEKAKLINEWYARYPGAKGRLP